MQNRKLFAVIMAIIVISLATIVTISLLQKDTVLAQASAPHLADADIQQILDGAEKAANKQDSLLRVNLEGEKQKTRMHIVVVDRSGKIVGQRSMTDAWLGSINIAKAKAFTAVAFSSNENALTSRSIGVLSQPGSALWQIGNSNRADGIIEFPGGVPLYKDNVLVGAIGVSGDGVEEDENVAEAVISQQSNRRKDGYEREDESCLRFSNTG